MVQVSATNAPASAEFVIPIIPSSSYPRVWRFPESGLHKHLELNFLTGDGVRFATLDVKSVPGHNQSAILKKSRSPMQSSYFQEQEYCQFLIRYAV